MSLKIIGISVVFLGLSAGLAQAADKPIIPFETHAEVVLDARSIYLNKNT